MTTLNNLQELEEHCATSHEPRTIVAVRDADDHTWIIRAATDRRTWNAIAFARHWPETPAHYRSVYDAPITFPIETLHPAPTIEPHATWEDVVATGPLHDLPFAQETNALETEALEAQRRQTMNEIYGIEANPLPHVTSVEVVSNQMQQLEAAAKAGSTDTGAGLIAAERQRQVTEEGYTPQHDHGRANELVHAAQCYTASRTVTGVVPARFPWAPQYWKPTGNPVRDLTIAGALIAAAIDALLQHDTLNTNPNDTSAYQAPQPNDRASDMGENHS